MLTKIMVYGSLKSNYWNHRLLEKSKYIGDGITVMDSFTMYNGGYPYVVIGGISKVFGEIYEVDEETLKHLDRLEGVPSHYVRTSVEVRVYNPDDVRMPGEEDVIEAIMYVASHGTSKELPKYREQVLPDHNNVLCWERKD